MFHHHHGRRPTVQSIAILFAVATAVIQNCTTTPRSRLFLNLHHHALHDRRMTAPSRDTSLSARRLMTMIALVRQLEEWLLFFATPYDPSVARSLNSSFDESISKVRCPMDQRERSVPMYAGAIFAIQRRLTGNVTYLRSTCELPRTYVFEFLIETGLRKWSARTSRGFKTMDWLGSLDTLNAGPYLR